jgi:hypothetical protein
MFFISELIYLHKINRISIRNNNIKIVDSSCRAGVSDEQNAKSINMTNEILFGQ